MTEPGYYSSDKRYTVSVTRATYARMLDASRERGVSLHSLVRIACRDIVGNAGKERP
jgi:hypothetical protein